MSIWTINVKFVGKTIPNIILIGLKSRTRVTEKCQLKPSITTKMVSVEICMLDIGFIVVSPVIADLQDVNITDITSNSAQVDWSPKEDVWDILLKNRKFLLRNW